MLFDAVTGNLVRKFPTGWCHVRFSPDSKTLLASLASSAHLWDIASGREIMPRAGHDGEVDSLLPMPDGKRLRSLGGYSEIRTWDLTSGEPLSVVRVGPLLVHRNGMFSSDGKRYISGNDDGSIRFWDLGFGRELRKLSINPLNRNIQRPVVLALGLSDEGNRLATLCGGSEQQAQGGSLPKRWIETLDAETGKTIHRWPIEVVGPSASFAPDGRSLVFRTQKGLAVRDAHTNHELAAIQGNLCGPYVFSPDGGLLAAASFKRVTPPGKRRRIEVRGGTLRRWS